MDGADVRVDKLHLALYGDVEEFSVRSEAGVVDQHVDIFFS